MGCADGTAVGWLVGAKDGVQLGSADGDEVG